MQCVILCAGKGTRMGALTAETPKPLLKVCGKPIIKHIVEALPSEVDELILVVGYLEEQIREYCGSAYLGKRVQYCVQENYAGGTGDALLCAKDLITGPFLFMYGDDIHGREALRAAASCPHAMLAMESDTPERFGVVMQNSDGTLREIIEKPENPESNLVNISGFVITPDIFTYDFPVSDSGERYVTDPMTAYAQDHSVVVIVQDTWLPIGYPEHIAAAETILCPDKS